MKLLMNQSEFQEVRRFVKNTQNPTVINGYNKLFDKNSTIPIKGVALPKTRDIVIEIAETESVQILKILANNGATFGEMLQRDATITSAPKWISFVKSIWKSIKNIFVH